MGDIKGDGRRGCRQQSLLVLFAPNGKVLPIGLIAAQGVLGLAGLDKLAQPEGEVGDGWILLEDSRKVRERDSSLSRSSLLWGSRGSAGKSSRQ
jgi:hypothetical protein